MADDMLAQHSDSLRDIQTRLEDMSRSLRRRYAAADADSLFYRRLAVALEHITSARNCMHWSADRMDDAVSGKERVLK